MAKARKPVSTGPRIVRCAIYTRKSTDEGLEQEFNSLDAQREACAAYIVSQRHEGWTLTDGHYDDGGFSGGNMDRPGLRRLLADVEAGRVDVIVVYKVDRLTRALSDFARIVDVLDARGASFVSITQSFNTTTSMGRLTLNVLLSFAQFEREVAGERIRDKIAQSKARGMWMGGPVALGYEVRDRKLIVDEADAEIVRHIFRRYAALGVGRLLIEELRADGYRTKIRKQADKTARGGVAFSRGMLFAMLSNRVYLGEIVHKGVPYPGEHEAIIDLELWETVQRNIEKNRVERHRGDNVECPSLLAGIIRDGHGRRLSPSHAKRATRRYRYYVTHSADLHEGGPEAWRMPAQDVERIVIERIRQLFSERQRLHRLRADFDARQASAMLAEAERQAARLDTLYGRRTITDALLTGVTIHEDRITIDIDQAGLARLLQIDGVEDGMIQLMASAIRVWRGNEIRLVLANRDGIAAERDDKLVALLSEAQAARALVMASPDRPIKHIAAEHGICRSRMAHLVRLSFLAPEIAAAIIDGRHPTNLTPRKLLTADFPGLWSTQKQMLGFA